MTFNQVDRIGKKCGGPPCVPAESTVNRRLQIAEKHGSAAVCRMMKMRAKATKQPHGWIREADRNYKFIEC